MRLCAAGYQSVTRALRFGIGHPIATSWLSAGKRLAAYEFGGAGGSARPAENCSYLRKVIFAGGLQTLWPVTALRPQTSTSVVMAGRSAGMRRFTCWTPVRVGAGPA